MGNSSTHALATATSWLRELAACIIASRADINPGSLGSSAHTATAARVWAAAAAPNTSAVDPDSVEEAASSRAAPCQRSSVRLVAEMRATRAAHPSRRTAELVWSIARRTHGTMREIIALASWFSELTALPSEGYPEDSISHRRRTEATKADSVVGFASCFGRWGGRSGARGRDSRSSRLPARPPHRGSGSIASEKARYAAASPRHLAKQSRMASPKPRDSSAPPFASLSNISPSKLLPAAEASFELHFGNPPAPCNSVPLQ